MSKQTVIEVKSRIAQRASNIKGRKEEYVPAIVYGPKQESTPVFIPNKFFVLNGTADDNTLYTLSGECLNGAKVMFKNIMKNPLGNKVLHADLYAPDLTKPVRVEVSIDFQGTPKGVSEGGIIQTIRREIEIECPADAIPESIVFDISNLELNEAYKVADIPVDSKFKVISSPEWAVITVAEVREESEEKATDSAEGGTPAPEAGTPE